MNEWDMDHTGRTSFGESDMMTKDEFSKSLAADFANAVEATYQDLIKAAVAAEREECAKVCETLEPVCYDTAGYTDCAAAIRARGNRT
jgi:hypothetical protein